MKTVKWCAVLEHRDQRSLTQKGPISIATANESAASLLTDANAKAKSAEFWWKLIINPP